MPVYLDVSERDLMLLSVAKQPFSAPGWIHEPKLDGFRVLAFAQPPRLLSRLGNPLTDQFPEVVEALGGLPAGTVLDGELVVCDERGHPQWERVRTRARMSRPLRIAAARRHCPATFYAFDVLVHDGVDLRREPLVKRKRVLSEIISDRSHPLRYVEHFDDGEKLFSEIVKRKLEGIVAKRAHSRYVAGRSRDGVRVRAPSARQQHRS